MILLMNTASSVILKLFWKALEFKDGAEGGTRTPTSTSPLPPQDSVSTSSTNSEKLIINYSYLI